MRHPISSSTTPNRVRSLVGTFAMANPFGFHAPDGEGYAMLADTILALDPLNPQVAARMATALPQLAMLEAKRREPRQGASNASSSTQCCRATLRNCLKSIAARLAQNRLPKLNQAVSASDAMPFVHAVSAGQIIPLTNQ